MTKDQKRKWKWRCKHAVTAITVCDRFLGAIPRDPTTIGALDVCRVLCGDNPHPDDIALKPLRMLLGSAPWMLVDARLRQRDAVLRPAQFVSCSTAFLDGSQAREDSKEIRPTQRLRERVINAVDGLNGLYLDWLFGGVTDFAARCHDLDGFDLAQKLWQQSQSRFPAMLPGDQFALLDDFAGILGLSGRFEWVKVPFAAGSTPKPPAHEATGL